MGPFDPRYFVERSMARGFLTIILLREINVDIDPKAHPLTFSIR